MILLHYYIHTTEIGTITSQYLIIFFFILKITIQKCDLNIVLPDPCYH